MRLSFDFFDHDVRFGFLVIIIVACLRFIFTWDRLENFGFSFDGLGCFESTVVVLVTFHWFARRCSFGHHGFLRLTIIIVAFDSLCSSLPFLRRHFFFVHVQRRLTSSRLPFGNGLDLLLLFVVVLLNDHRRFLLHRRSKCSIVVVIVRCRLHLRLFRLVYGFRFWGTFVVVILSIGLSAYFFEQLSNGGVLGGQRSIVRGRLEDRELLARAVVEDFTHEVPRVALEDVEGQALEYNIGDAQDEAHFQYERERVFRRVDPFEDTIEHRGEIERKREEEIEKEDDGDQGGRATLARRWGTPFLALATVRCEKVEAERERDGLDDENDEQDDDDHFECRRETTVDGAVMASRGDLRHHVAENGRSHVIHLIFDEAEAELFANDHEGSEQGDENDPYDAENNLNEVGLGEDRCPGHC